jgi:hypothetical protein
MPAPDSPAGQGGGHRALPDPGRPRDADPYTALLGGEDPVQDLGERVRIVLDRADQAGAGQPPAFEEIIPQLRPDRHYKELYPCSRRNQL